MSAKDHPQGYFVPIPLVSLLRECQNPMNLTPVAKITSTAGNNTQRHIPAPHLPQNYTLETFKATALIALKKMITAASKMDPKFNM